MIETYDSNRYRKYVR